MLERLKNAESAFMSGEDCHLQEFHEHVSQKTEAADYPFAAEIVKNIPIYDGDALREHFASDETAFPVMSELNRVFQSGPGVLAIRKGYNDIDLVDQVTAGLSEIIAEEAGVNGGKGDHFAAAGANSRVWNAHEKLAVRDPELFARYNANEIVRRVSEAWLGLGYQITTQVNVVRPGGMAQTPHRDYHMGFQTEETLRYYPISQHALSASLTLQGAVAHSDMPMESGPTKLLPYSQSYVPGYFAVNRKEFRDYFEAHYVQMPLLKGDMLFFNPATFHGAGDNKTTDVQRFANLMQVGSTYGRSIEIVDRTRITKAVYPYLKKLAEKNALTQREVDNVVAATAEGYPFPCNLDLDPPIGGMAPASQQHVMRQALAEGWDAVRLDEAIDAQQGRRRSH